MHERKLFSYRTSLINVPMLQKTKNIILKNERECSDVKPKSTEIRL